MTTPTHFHSYWAPHPQHGAQMVAVQFLRTAQEAGQNMCALLDTPTCLVDHTADLDRHIRTWRPFVANRMGPFSDAHRCARCVDAGPPPFVLLICKAAIGPNKGHITRIADSPFCPSCLSRSPRRAPDPAAAHALLAAQRRTQDAIRAHFGTACTAIDGAAGP